MNSPVSPGSFLASVGSYSELGSSEEESKVRPTGLDASAEFAFIRSPTADSLPRAALCAITRPHRIGFRWIQIDRPRSDASNADPSDAWADRFGSIDSEWRDGRQSEIGPEAAKVCPRQPSHTCEVARIAKGTNRANGGADFERHLRGGRSELIRTRVAVTPRSRVSFRVVKNLLIAVAIGTGVVISAQVPPQQGGFRSGTDLVPVYATVLDKNGAFVRGMKKEDFTVLDDGKPQTIVSFSDEAQPISVAVILDTSSSMRDMLPRVFGAARVFLDQLRPDDRAMMGTLVYQGPPFTSDKRRLRTSLDLAPPDPGSPVFGALDRALNSLAPETNRPVIVIYSDGRNQELPGRRPPNPPTAGSVRARAERAGVMVYAVSFEGMKLTNDMKTISVRSGGRATELKSTDDLGAVLAGIADELHQQYLLGFTPASFDGRTHAIDVKIKSPEHIVRARQNYTARSQEHKP